MKAKHRSEVDSTLNRRQFVTRLALAGGATGFPGIVRAQSPGGKLNLAIIGCGGRGGYNMQQFIGENIVALCDVNENDLLKASQKAPGAKKFRDFRRLYDGLKDSEFDAAVVSTTEHTHVFAVLPALERKKHVYCEKPLAHNLREARPPHRGRPEGRRGNPDGDAASRHQQLPPAGRDGARRRDRRSA